MSYVYNLYGDVPQQLTGALVPSDTNRYTGNLIQQVTGGARRARRGTRRGGGLEAIVPMSLLAAQQLYGRTRFNGRRFKSNRFRKYRNRSRRYGTR